MSRPTVAIVGRPNVGKSTLFNRLIGGRSAIVSDQAGTTRDRHFGDGDWNGRRFWLIDTGGLVPESSQSMDKALSQFLSRPIRTCASSPASPASRP